MDSADANRLVTMLREIIDDREPVSKACPDLYELVDAAMPHLGMHMDHSLLMAASRTDWNHRRRWLLAEVSVVHSCLYRAGLLPQPYIRDR